MRAYHAGLLALGAALWAVPAGAQTRFDWPDTTVDLASYTTIEECRAAVGRTLRSAEAREELTTGIWPDTMPLDSVEALGPRNLRAPVTETARRCAARFGNADSVSLDDFGPLVRLYLQAGWDDRARSLIDRRLAAIGPSDDDERAAVIDSVISVLGGFGGEIGRRRSEMAWDLIESELPKVADRVKRLTIYVQMSMFVSKAHPDSALMRMAGVSRTISGILDSLTDREMDELVSKYGILAEGIDDAGDFVHRYYAMLNMTLGEQTFLDSLRRSTAAYVKLRLDNWTRATGLRAETYGFGNPLGEHAPPLEADIWVGYDPAKGPRPAPGRISLVVFVNSHECNGTITRSYEMYGNCASVLEPLARLEDRFPELDITVVAESHGYFLYLKDGITPEKEAQLTKRWLEAHGVDAPLAMTTSASWRLPDPDGRRLSRPTDNRTNYSFGGKWEMGSGKALLIDADGTVVHGREMNRWSTFEEYGAMIEILLERQVAERAR